MEDKKNPGGRPLSPVRKSFREALEQIGINPLRELGLLATHKDTPIEKKIEIYKDFLKYEWPTAKEIQYKVDDKEGKLAAFMKAIAEDDRPLPPTATAPKKPRKKKTDE